MSSPTPTPTPTPAAPLAPLLRTLPSLKGPFPPPNTSELPPTPQGAFHAWLSDAIAHGVKEPHAMTLSTVGADGAPDARVLILKNVDARGWHFATKADSPKGVQIGQEDRVALTFYWAALGRQVRIRGRAAALGAEECAADFRARPVGARAVAVASRQSAVMVDREELQGQITEARRMLEEEGQGYVAPEWRVYAVDPETVEFWQGAEDRRHQRVRYEKQGVEGEWEKVMLYP
ncbi:pyridoxamine 5'-phosphate oxidase [Paraphaeosphaeria sporulosa]|uniref:pyridoxal 5'-phosphate synthase n=1 Tax=Paraphaeosphaeria sporulosa TaxID=1460663 RepID=A0A177CF54_9PLEO|nr:pyridoxamine 5'-phosphate oxidase [Paraphaeosphaeria sporulosa]OAG05459.1 pyridoxamine 5'-phosphate oxidase [Paraphaeosphaeria sporulosa]